MERTWNGLGTDMERSWNGNGTDMERTWNGHGTDMERSWNGHGTDMERSFLKQMMHHNILTTNSFSKAQKLFITPKLEKHFTKEAK